MSRGIVYLIINKQNGQKFIGETTQPMNKTWQQHIKESSEIRNKILHHSIREHGNYNFMIKELDECDENLLRERKEYWKKQYNAFDVEKEIEIEEKIPEIIIKKKPQQTWGFLTDKNRGNGKHSGIRIQGLNIETGEIKEWQNARDAAEEVTGNRNKNSNILVSARRGYKCYGYRWKLLEKKTKKKAVKAIDKITWEEYYFESISDAIRKVGNNQTRGTGLVKSLRSNGRYTWRGYMWFYS